MHKMMSAQRIRTFYSLTLFLLDAAAIIGANFIAHAIRLRLPYPEPYVLDVPVNHYYPLWTMQFFSILLLLALNRQYYIPRAPSRLVQLYNVVIEVTFGLVLGIAISLFIFKGNEFIIDFPRMTTLYTWGLTIGLLVLNRLLHQAGRDYLRTHGVGKDRLLIVGTGDVAQLTLQRIQWSPQLGYDVVGIVTPHKEIKNLLDVPVIGYPEQLPELIEQYRISDVIIALPEEGHREVVQIASYCQRGRVTIKIFPDVFQFITSEATIDDLGGLPLLTVRDFAMRGYLLVFKRVMDIFGALVGLIFLSPLMLIGAILIKLESKGSAFFIQERMGLDGQLIQMIKFRSMSIDSEKNGPGWTVKDDPRRTRIGRIIRKTNIDELPQLINVLLGEMSLVGPRPEQPYYVEQFRKTVSGYMARHQLRGGMTGWAQVNGLRGDTSITERTKYDLWYIENWSLGLDITIIIRTIWQTLAGKNEEAG